mmetsp:Transcript_13390/g.28340  ORF Transcript_13390/g.28340 Transcript_13390/m.28340 type:complete len:116 (+) Transcript_13390:2-349(+)
MCRSLHFTVELLRQIEAQRAAGAHEPALVDIFRRAYSRVLESYHRLPLRSIFYASSRQAPTYLRLLETLAPMHSPAEQEEVVLAASRRFIKAAMPIVRKIQADLKSARLTDTRRV